MSAPRASFAPHTLTTRSPSTATAHKHPSSSCRTSSFPPSSCTPPSGVAHRRLSCVNQALFIHSHASRTSSAVAPHLSPRRRRRVPHPFRPPAFRTRIPPCLSIVSISAVLVFALPPTTLPPSSVVSLTVDVQLLVYHIASTTCNHSPDLSVSPPWRPQPPVHRLLGYSLSKKTSSIALCWTHLTLKVTQNPFLTPFSSRLPCRGPLLTRIRVLPLPRCNSLFHQAAPILRLMSIITATIPPTIFCIALHRCLRTSTVTISI